jgi:hypothetical protein
MPGFGAGPFGREPFGEWKWSRRVLFEYIPEVYRESDGAADGLLETFSESLRPSFDELRRQIRDLDTLRDPFTVRTQFTETERITLGPQIVPVGELEQRGVDARVDATQQFIAPGGRFSIIDIGKELTVTNSAFDVNNKTVVIAGVANPTTVLTEPNFDTDPGPLTWELRPTVTVTEGVVTVQVRGGDVSGIKPGWKLNDGFAEFTVQARRQFPAISSSPSFLTDREGNDGAINGSNNFTSPLVNFVQADVGKLISVSTSVIPENNNRWEILSVESATEAVVQNSEGDAPAIDGQPFFWALLPFAELDLTSTIAPRGTIEQEGLLGEITAAGPPSVFKSSEGAFTATDVGKRLTISGSTIPLNNTTSEIFSVLAADTVELVDALTVEAPASPGLRWEVRRATAIGNLGQVDVRATSLIKSFAQDFGIEIDSQENEDRQRSWVANVSRWIQQKGTQKGYEIIANISGFNVEVIPLFRVSINQSDAFPVDLLFEIGESGSGRSGTDGSLSEPGTSVQFSSPTGAFLKSDCGIQVRIRDAAVPGNEKLYTIEDFIDSNTVEMRPIDTVTLPEGNNGALTWAIIRLYTNQPPAIPNFDEVDADFMEQIIDGDPVQTTDFFGVDKYCWEDDFFADVEISVDSVAAISPGVFDVTSTGVSQGPNPILGDPGVVKLAGNWKLIDSVGSEFFVETVPAETPPASGDWLFEVKAALSPATGAAVLRYDCPVNLTCDYCGASRVLLRITLGTIANETGAAIERVLDRVLLRFDQVTPAHVQIVPVLSQEISMGLDITVTVEPAEILAAIYAPKDAYYDDVPADIIVADPNLQSTDVPHFSEAGQADYPYTDLVLRCTVETP